jgi:glycosidase
VSIYFNAALGNGGLLGYDGDVYVHTGVITSLSTGPSDWRYVLTEWGENTPQTRMEPLGNDIYVLEISHLRDFYQVPAAEDILQIALVFRSDVPVHGNQYLEGKNADGSDIFVDVYEQALAVKITSPSRREPLVGDVPYLALCVEAMENETIELFLNDSLLLQQHGQSITYGLEVAALEPGTHYVVAVAQDDASSSVSDTVAIFVRPPVDVAGLPAGVVNGINYIDDSTVTLVLHDPPGQKNFVFAIGDYSRWQPNEENYMKRTPDGTHFWVTISGLEPGVEYAFQYYIDGNLKIADPYAEKILDPWNDRWIPESTYPELMDYPYDLTTGIVGVLQTQRPDYNWQVTGFVPPALNETQSDLFIYELLIRDFVESRDIKDVEQKLDYLQNLGVNAVQLMPIMEFDGNESWGYAPNFFFATDKYYGRREDYKAFIDACHARDMAVILDIVPNHAFGQNPMVLMYFDPQAGDHGQPLPQNPWFNQQAPHPYSVGYDFNHESPYTREFFKRVFEYWLTEFRVDGFRIDLSKGLTQTWSGEDMGAWSAYDQSRINILTDYYNHIKSVNPNAYVILEHFAHNDEETVLANTGMLLWGAVHDNYKQVNIGYVQGSDLSWAYHGTRGWNYPNIIDYMENHDEERITYEAITYGNASGGYDIRDSITALRRMEMSAVLFFGIPGPKMIWQFGELGYDYSIFYGGDRTAPKPVRWDYWDDPHRQRIYRVYAAMAGLRKHDAFRFGQFTHDLGGEGKRMWVTHSSMNVVIAANMGVEGFNMAPGFQHNGTWYDYVSGESIQVSDAGGHTMYFAPGQYRVFTNVPVSRPFFHVDVSVVDGSTQQPVEGAEIFLQGSGNQFSGTDGFAWFTAFPGEAQLTVQKDGFPPFSQTLNVDDDLSVTVVLQTDGTNVMPEPVEKTRVRVFPNPARGQLFVESPQHARVEVFNLQGRLLMQAEVGPQVEALDVSGLGAGVFLLRVTGKGFSEVTRVLFYD